MGFITLHKVLVIPFDLAHKFTTPVFPAGPDNMHHIFTGLSKYVPELHVSAFRTATYLCHKLSLLLSVESTLLEDRVR